MGKKANLIKTAGIIRKALADFVSAGEVDKIHVFESSPGCLRAVVVSDKFKEMGITDRQEVIWKYLSEKVDRSHLQHCWGVHPMDMEEYEEESFRHASSASVERFMGRHGGQGGVDE